MDPQGDAVISNNLDVTGDTNLHDTTISSTLTVGGTTIASETGNVNVDGTLTVGYSSISGRAEHQALWDQSREHPGAPRAVRGKVDDASGGHFPP